MSRMKGLSMGHKSSNDGGVHRSHQLTEKVFKKIWGRLCGDDYKPISIQKAKNVLKSLAKVVDYKEYNERVVDQLIPVIISDRIIIPSGKVCNEKLLYDEFSLLVWTICTRAKLDILDSSFTVSVIPHNIKLKNRFHDYIGVPFDTKQDTVVLQELWKSAYPYTSTPPIPSDLWKQELGFWSEDPCADFEGVANGKFIIECLFELTRHREFFLQIQESAKRHEFPIIYVGTQTVQLILELLGWGTKSSEVPVGVRPQTYKIMCGLLFNFKHGIQQEDFDVTCVTFYKIYFLAFGIVASIWEAMKASYTDFPNILERASPAVEETLKVLPNHSALDRYLIAYFGIDIMLFQDKETRFFQIWLPKNEYKLYPYNPKLTLGDVLQGIPFKEPLQPYSAYSISGEKINTQTSLDRIRARTVYYLPEGTTPLIGNQWKWACLTKCHPPIRPIHRKSLKHQGSWRMTLLGKKKETSVVSSPLNASRTPSIYVKNLLISTAEKYGAQDAIDTLNKENMVARAQFVTESPREDHSVEGETAAETGLSVEEDDPNRRGVNEERGEEEGAREDEFGGGDELEEGEFWHEADGGGHREESYIEQDPEHADFPEGEYQIGDYFTVPPDEHHPLDQDPDLDLDPYRDPWHQPQRRYQDRYRDSGSRDSYHRPWEEEPPPPPYFHPRGEDPLDPDLYHPNRCYPYHQGRHRHERYPPETYYQPRQNHHRCHDQYYQGKLPHDRYPPPDHYYRGQLPHDQYPHPDQYYQRQHPQNPYSPPGQYYQEQISHDQYPPPDYEGHFHTPIDHPFPPLDHYHVSDEYGIDHYMLIQDQERTGNQDSYSQDDTTVEDLCPQHDPSPSLPIQNLSGSGAGSSSGGGGRPRTSLSKIDWCPNVDNDGKKPEPVNSGISEDGKNPESGKSGIDFGFMKALNEEIKALDDFMTEIVIPKKIEEDQDSHFMKSIKEEMARLDNFLSDIKSGGTPKNSVGICSTKITYTKDNNFDSILEKEMTEVEAIAVSVVPLIPQVGEKPPGNPRRPSLKTLEGGGTTGRASGNTSDEEEYPTEKDPKPPVKIPEISLNFGRDPEKPFSSFDSIKEKEKKMNSPFKSPRKKVLDKLKKSSKSPRGGGSDRKTKENKENKENTSGTPINPGSAAGSASSTPVIKSPRLKLSRTKSKNKMAPAVQEPVRPVRKVRWDLNEEVTYQPTTLGFSPSSTPQTSQTPSIQGSRSPSPIPQQQAPPLMQPPPLPPHKLPLQRSSSIKKDTLEDDLISELLSSTQPQTKAEQASPPQEHSPQPLSRQTSINCPKSFSLGFIEYVHEPLAYPAVRKAQSLNSPGDPPFVTGRMSRNTEKTPVIDECPVPGLKSVPAYSRLIPETPKTPPQKALPLDVLTAPPLSASQTAKPLLAASRKTRLSERDSGLWGRTSETRENEYGNHRRPSTFHLLDDQSHSRIPPNAHYQGEYLTNGQPLPQEDNLEEFVETELDQLLATAMQ